jgi:hypothetical protein
LAKRPPPGPIDLQEHWRTERARADVPLDASWCHAPAPDFIGPLCPPGQLWFARGRPKGAWQIRAEARIAALSALPFLDRQIDRGSEVAIATSEAGKEMGNAASTPTFAGDVGGGHIRLTPQNKPGTPAQRQQSGH